MHFVPLDLLALTEEERSLYKRYVPPLHWPALEAKDSWDVSSSVIDAIAVFNAGAPIGLALSSFYSHLSFAELLVFHVEEPFNTKDILLLLLKHIEELLKSKNCKLLTHLYLTTHPAADKLEPLLRSQGWALPRLFLVRCHFYVQDFHPYWMQKGLPLPLGCTLGLWVDISEADKQLVEQKFDRGNIQAGFSPFDEHFPLSSINSLVLYDSAKNIVGWMVCHLVSADTIRYTSLYLERQFRSSRAFVALLATAIHLQQETALRKSVLEVNVEQVDSIWIHFVKSRLIPYTYLVERYNSISHSLRE